MEFKILISEDKEITTKEASISDITPMVGLLKKLADETNFMMREHGNVNQGFINHDDRVKSAIEDETNLFLISKTNDKIVGFLILSFQSLMSMQSVGSFVVGVKREYWGIGIASSLIECMLDWSKLKKMKRVELEVVEDNVRAIKLYEKYGFKMDRKKIADHYIGNNRYLNTIIMVKNLI